MQQIQKQNVFQKQMYPETNKVVYFSLQYIKIFETCHLFSILYPLVATEISTLIMPPMHMRVWVILKHCLSEKNKQTKKKQAYWINFFPCASVFLHAVVLSIYPDHMLELLSLFTVCITYCSPP